MNDAKPAADRSQFRVVTPMRVRFAEADPQGIVHNSNYLVYADAGLCEYTRTLMVDQLGVDEPGILRRFSDHFGGNSWVRHAELDYRAPARSDDLIDVGVRIERFGRTSYSSLVHIMRDDLLLVEIHMTYVWFEQATQQVHPVSEKFVQAVKAFERVAPVSPD